MAALMRVPEVAAGASEAILSEWLVDVGTPFAGGDAIAVLETDKAVVEVEAETDAVILRTLVEGGAMVEVGSPMAVIGSGDEVDADVDALLAELSIGEITSTPAESRREVSEAEAQAVESPTTASGEKPPTSRVFISPIARKLLSEAGVPIEVLVGTGPGGRIIRKDVESAIIASAEERAAEPVVPVARPAPTVQQIGHRDEPHSRIRRAIATRLTQSKQEVPHFYVKRTVRIDSLMTLRAEVNQHTMTKISVNDLLIKAIAVAHTRVPEANVIWTDDALRYFDHVDISVAVASERGLVTPVLRNVAGQSVGAISSAVKMHVEQANSGKLQQQDLEGGSISISNLGMFGVDEFSAIINPPQSAILAVGAGRPAPVIVDGALAIATCMELVLSVDHRAIDGTLAARWMDTLVTVLEQPMTLLV
ncbi:pyruvate dehydrogenase complex dihydrolipoamide acetyltransferase [Amycolatopsis ultiminotia]|uniref:Dihydrolipoamide acetyltransferase component of pyruvate dehydrogenase complex n=1 Tax=Amycolatopsis ultiminotia TaxID=543629 RepID=A0ABP6WI42_9PSEU